MYPFGVDYFYSKFWSMFGMPEYIALAGTAFILILLMKTWMLTLTGYKKFGGAILISGISNVISIAGLFMLLYLKIHFTDNLLIFCGAVIGMLLFIDLLITVIFKGKSNLADGMIGAALGNLIVATTGLVIIIFQLFPLT